MTTNIDPITQHILDEIIKTSNVSTIDKSSKIKRTVGQLSSAEARKRNDPLYKKMIKYRELYFKYRDVIHKRYGPRVVNKARR